MSGRQLLLALTVGLLLLAGLLFYSMGESAWRLWNIPVMQPSFADARSILTGVQAQRLGYDPLFQNPLDSFGRVMAYPRIWLLLAAFPLSAANTVAFAAVEIGLFLVGLWIFADKVERPAAIAMAAMAFSPAAMLCFERGNTDLVVFLLLGAALALPSYLPAPALALTELAAFLKLYPVVALGLLLRETRKNAALWLSAGLTVFAIYAALTWKDIRQVFAMASKGVGFNYGVGVIGLWLRDLTRSAQFGDAVLACSYLAAYVMLLFALYRSQRLGASLAAASPRLLDAFRVGALLYAGTFLQGNTWNYRLIFLIFSLPQLVEWSRAEASFARNIARLSLALVLVSAWFPLLGASEPPAPSLTGILEVLLDELANWLLFVALCDLLFASLPDWLREQVSLFFEKYRRLARAER